MSANPGSDGAPAPLRILQLNSARRPIGESGHTLNLTKALRQAGHTVVLGLRGGHITHQMAETLGLTPVAFHMAHPWWPPHDWRDLRKLARLVREQDIQLIHAHRGKDHWLAALAVELFRLRRPVIRTRHVVTHLHDTAANRWLARRTAALITVSQAVASDVASTGLYRGKAELIAPGVDFEWFAARGRRAESRRKLGVSESVRVAVCVARFQPVKAHRVLLPAWRQVVTALPDAVLLLAGNGPLEGAAREQVRQLGLEANVRMLGHVVIENVPELLEAADVGVLSSVGSEGFSRAVLEYMAMRLPVVATRVGAVPDLVEDGLTGRIVPPEDVEALAGALHETLTAPAEQRAAWGEAGRRKAESKHSFAVWVAAHERLYRRVLGTGGS